MFSDLVRLETELWDAVDARLHAACGLTLGRFDTMRVIARTPSCRVCDVADGLSITAGGASKMIDRIEAAGHCARRANPDDRRSSLVGLTPAGTSLLDEATAVVQDELAIRLGSVLSARALEQLSSTIATLRSARAEERKP
ncbi:MAG: MarR family transcriptional regulator [Pseudonocardia sp.]|nr:MarR family transcriptional regulator [Pseudonocardia sp.]